MVELWFEQGGLRGMKTLRSRAIAAVLIMFAAVSLALAQGPVQKRVNYTINVNHALRMGDYMLPPGKYVLYQVSQNDLNLFGLYRDDLTDEPLAMIRTTRVEYQPRESPSKSTLMLDIEESSVETHPVLRGWNIPGDDGWEIISVVSKRGILTRVK
jgi:hypothetical protein